MDQVYMYMRVCIVGVCDTENFGIDPIPSKYRASIADTDSNTCHLKKNIHLNDQQQFKKMNNN